MKMLSEKEAYEKMWILLDCLSQGACPEDKNNVKIKCPYEGKDKIDCKMCFETEAKKLLIQIKRPEGV